MFFFLGWLSSCEPWNPTLTNTFIFIQRKNKTKWWHDWAEIRRVQKEGWLLWKTESQQSKWVVGEDLVTSKLSKVVVFCTLLTWEVNNMFRETQGREAELIRVSSGFAVDCSCSSSSGMVGNAGGAETALLCGHWGCQTRGCGGAISFVPIPQPGDSCGVQPAESISSVQNSSSRFSHCGSTAGGFC